MRVFVSTLLFLLLTSTSTLVSAYEVLDICARYKNTNKAYKVEATLIDGAELNQRTSTLNYDGFAKYVVIFWGEGKSTVIKLDIAIGGINMFGKLGQDQQGRAWEVSTNTQLCF